MRVETGASCEAIEAEAGRIGSADWVRDRLSDLPAGQARLDDAAARELIDWLYTVVRRRAGALSLPSDVRRDVAQEAMGPLVRALHSSRDRIAGADNPAAMLERVASRAVTAGRHRARMAGMGGVPANGQHWRATFPRQLGGDAALRVLESLPAPEHEPCRSVEDTAARLADWVSEYLGVALSARSVDAVVYVLDRMVAGVSRAALVRGGHSGLAVDPAMRHLGFDAQSAAAFGCWLLGRRDTEHNTPSVLDAFLDGGAPPSFVAERCRRQAIKFEFAADDDAGETAVA